MSSQKIEIPISMDEQNILDLSNNKNYKNYNRLLYDMGIFLKNSDLTVKERFYNNIMRTVWFDSLTELSITDTYNSVICKLRSLNILKAQIEEIDKKLKEYWNELIYLSTTKEQYQELSSSLIKRDLANCKKIIKESCKIGEKFQYKNKEYETTQSGILAGIYLIDKIKISDVKNYLLKGTSFPQVEEFKEYMSKFEKYNMEALFGKFVVDLAPIARGNYESNFKNNPNGVAGQKCENSASNKIMIKNYRLNYYSLNVPNYIDENGVEKNIDNTTVKKDYVIEDITPQGKAVCNGAMIKCSGSLGGTYPLTILPKINIFMNDKPIGVLSNSKIGENISNFGMCKLTSNPSVSLNQNKPFACQPVQISQWINGISYFTAGDEKVISDKSTCMCSYGGIISIENNQEGQSFFGYANGGNSAGNGKDDKSEEDKKKEEEEKEKSEKLKGKVDNGVDGKVDKDEFLIKKGDNGEIVKEINIRLMGFGGGLPSKEYNDYTVKVVKQFKTDYMKQANADGTFVDMATIEAIDKFAEEYPITEAEFNQMKCKCGQCDTFSRNKKVKGVTTGWNKDKNKTEPYPYIEYPGMSKILLWGNKALKYYLNKNGYDVIKIESGYRCHLDNYNRLEKQRRRSTNHMGNALDLHIGNRKTKKRIISSADIDKIRTDILVPNMGCQMGWPNKNKFSLERIKDGADTWIHIDVREFEEKFMSDEMYLNNNNLMTSNIKLKKIIE